MKNSKYIYKKLKAKLSISRAACSPTEVYLIWGRVISVFNEVDETELLSYLWSAILFTFVQEIQVQNSGIGISQGKKRLRHAPKGVKNWANQYKSIHININPYKSRNTGTTKQHLYLCFAYPTKTKIIYSSVDLFSTSWNSAGGHGPLLQRDSSFELGACI